MVGERRRPLGDVLPPRVGGGSPKMTGGVSGESWRN